MSERLPVHEALPALREALREGRNAVLEAPPGAGKSTVVPLALLDEPWAQRSAASCCSSRAGSRPAPWPRAWRQRWASRVGETVGYRMRLDTRVGPRTRTRSRHRRRAHAHAAAGCGARRRRGGALRRIPRAQPARRPRPRARARLAGEHSRPTLRLLVMSATLDGERGGAAARRCAGASTAGRAHVPVAMHYLGRGLPALPRPGEPSRACHRAAGGAVQRVRRRNDGRRAGVPAGRRRDPPAAGLLESDPARPGARRARAVRRARARASRTRRSRPPRRAGARSCWRPTSPRPASPSTACASSSTRACAALAVRSGHRHEPAGDAAHLARSADAARRPRGPHGAGRCATGCGARARSVRSPRRRRPRSSPPISRRWRWSWRCGARRCEPAALAGCAAGRGAGPGARSAAAPRRARRERPHHRARPRDAGASAASAARAHAAAGARPRAGDARGAAGRAAVGARPAARARDPDLRTRLEALQARPRVDPRALARVRRQVDGAGRRGGDSDDVSWPAPSLGLGLSRTASRSGAAAEVRPSALSAGQRPGRDARARHRRSAARDYLVAVDLDDADAAAARIRLAAPLTLARHRGRARRPDRRGRRDAAATIARRRCSHGACGGSTRWCCGEGGADGLRATMPHAATARAAARQGLDVAALGRGGRVAAGAAAIRRAIAWRSRVAGRQSTTRRCWAGLSEWLAPFLTGHHAAVAAGAHRPRGGAALAARYAQRRRLDELAPTHVTLPTGTRAPVDYRRRQRAVPRCAHAGSVRARRHAAHRRRPRAGHVEAAVARAPADADHARPRGLLARQLRRGAQGHARPLSAALLAGESAGSRADARPASRRIARLRA